MTCPVYVYLVAAAVVVVAVAVAVAGVATTSMIPCRAMDLINYRTVTLAITK